MVDKGTKKLKKVVKLICPDCNSNLIVSQWVETLTPAVKAEKEEYFTIEKDKQTTLYKEEAIDKPKKKRKKKAEE